MSRPMSQRDDRGLFRVVAGVAALVLFFGVMLVVVAALTFSVQVSGTSMMPTLRDGDRLEVDLLARHDIHRFDVVEAVEPAATGSGGGAHIVKRVIGLPGDQIAIAGGSKPVVYVRQRGSATTYVVDNPTWNGRTGGAVAGCCTEGLVSLDSTARRWQTVPARSYFLMGDNWGASTDSRVFGPVAAADVIAKLNFRIMPLGRFGSLSRPARLVRAK